jgi:hypothetical protein
MTDIHRSIPRVGVYPPEPGTRHLLPAPVFVAGRHGWRMAARAIESRFRDGAPEEAPLKNLAALPGPASFTQGVA